MSGDLPELLVADAAAWRRWLEAHVEGQGVWLVLARTGRTEPTALTHDEALDEALCVGWIDGQVQARDAACYRQRFTPRRPRSAWSRHNVEHAERLGREGRPCRARRDQARRGRRPLAGRLRRRGHDRGPRRPRRRALGEPRGASVLRAALGQNRYAVLYRLGTARRPETRARRLARFVEMFAQGETIYPQRRAPGSG